MTLQIHPRELETINDNQSKYSQDELRSRIIRWVDKIENEIDFVSSRTRELNNRGRSALHSMQRDTNDLIISLSRANVVDRRQIIAFIQTQAQYRVNLAHLVENIRSIIPMLKQSFSAENSPRRLRIATDSLSRELDDLANITAQVVVLIDRMMQLAQSKLH